MLNISQIETYWCHLVTLFSICFEKLSTFQSIHFFSHTFHYKTIMQVRAIVTKDSLFLFRRTAS